MHCATPLPLCPHCPATPLSSKLFSRWRLSKRSTDLRRSCSLHGRATVGRQPHPSPRTEANRATGDLMGNEQSFWRQRKGQMQDQFLLCLCFTEWCRVLLSIMRVGETSLSSVGDVVALNRDASVQAQRNKVLWPFSSTSTVEYVR